MKKVIVLSGLSLFGTGIESLLSNDDEIEIVTWNTMDCDIAKCIRKNSPDAIIINCENPTHDITPAIFCALRERFDILLIGLNLSNNFAIIYRRVQKQMINLEDLLPILRN
jgi:AmiR/NasT family two-component response regulator